MKKLISKTLFAISAISMSVFTSCSNDDNAAIFTPSVLTVALTELGHGGTPPHAHAGEDLHIEAEIFAEAKIASVKLEIHSESNPSFPEISAIYSDYNGLLNATFHKHIDIPSNQPAGIYHLHLVVTDQSGNSETAEVEIEILGAELEGDMAINLTEIGPDISNPFAIAGEDLHISGTITSAHAIALVSIEIHNETDANAPEINEVYSSYAGQTTASFHKHILIPANQPAGQYHLHFTVTDDEGHSKTVEYELEIQ